MVSTTLSIDGQRADGGAESACKIVYSYADTTLLPLAVLHTEIGPRTLGEGVEAECLSCWDLPLAAHRE
jgi:hypothetical protein